MLEQIRDGASCQGAARDIDRSLLDLGPGSTPAAFPPGSNWCTGRRSHTLGCGTWAGRELVPTLVGVCAAAPLGGGHSLSIIGLCIFMGGFLFQA